MAKEQVQPRSQLNLIATSLILNMDYWISSVLRLNSLDNLSRDEGQRQGLLVTFYFSPRTCKGEFDIRTISQTDRIGLHRVVVISLNLSNSTSREMLGEELVGSLRQLTAGDNAITISVQVQSNERDKGNKGQSQRKNSLHIQMVY